MIVNQVVIYLEYTSNSEMYCKEYLYHLYNANDSWLEANRDFHDREAQKYLELFNEAFKKEYPMFAEYPFRPKNRGGVPCCQVDYDISPRIFPPHKDF